jgi:hypothetical protein
MPGNDLVFVADQDRICKAKPTDAVGNLSYLLLGMGAGIVGEGRRRPIAIGSMAIELISGLPRAEDVSPAFVPSREVCLRRVGVCMLRSLDLEVSLCPRTEAQLVEAWDFCRLACRTAYLPADLPGCRPLRPSKRPMVS